MLISFFVEGKPVPQGSVTSYGRHIVAVSPALRQWRDLVRDASIKEKTGLERPIGTPCGLSVVFHLQRPQRPKFAVPGVKPDGDKLLRAIQDALTDTKKQPGLVKDDALFVVGSYEKRYGTNLFGALIKVWTL